MPAAFYWYKKRRSSPGRSPRWVDYLLQGAIAPTDVGPGVKLNSGSEPSPHRADLDVAGQGPSLLDPQYIDPNTNETVSAEQGAIDDDEDVSLNQDSALEMRKTLKERKSDSD